MEQLAFDVIDPASAEGQELLHEYILEVAHRFYGRPATAAEMTAALGDRTADRLTEPEGLLVVVTRAGQLLGCGGMRLLPGGIGELTRVYVRTAARGLGAGVGLVQELERLARERGLTALRLDTRTDLIEARMLYARMGFIEIPAYNNDPYAQHWLGKDLG